MEIPLLKDIVVIFGLSIAVLLICHRIKIPSVVGFLITGILAGPYALGLVGVRGEVKSIAEIGIILLLFTVGLELSIKKILKFKRYFFIAGPIQVGFTIAGGALSGHLLGRTMAESVFLGYLLSLSSTAIVMKILQERAETNTPHGRFSLGILIFQDIIVVLMMLTVPILAGEGANIDSSLLLLLGKGVLILVVTFFSALQLVPTLLYHVARTRNRELFLLTLLLICFSVAWITSSIGLSLALGAFLAGLTISESEYSNQAMGDIIPFKDIFTSFFFVSVGMLLDIDFFLKNLMPIFSLTLGILFLKGIVVTCTALFLGFPLRPAVLSGIALSQVGEFSFVLAMSGIQHHIGTDYLHQLFIAVAVLTMGMTPMLIAFSPKLASLALRLPLPAMIRSSIKKKEEISQAIFKKDHLVIVGYGFTGKNLSRSSREADIPYVIIDINPEIVREEKQKGVPIYFGDATRDRMLKHSNLQNAKVLAVLINDPIASLRIVEQARKMNPSLYIIVRTRYIEEMAALFQLGANDVIPDELGTSVEIFSRVLTKYEVSHDHVERLVTTLRTEGYELLRPHYSDVTFLSDLKESLADVGIKTFLVKENSIIAGATIHQLELRKKYGLTVLVIKRGDETIYNIDPRTAIKVGDKIVVVGTNENLKKFYKILS